MSANVGQTLSAASACGSVVFGYVPYASCGGFAEFAARDLGCRVTGLTISREQRDFAARRVQEAGLADRVEIMLRDYRDESGTYDKIASIEMLEAVGEKYWPVFFGKMKACLKAGGSAGLGEEIAPGLHEAELAYLHEHEWARSADDVLWRRTKLGLHLNESQRQAVARWWAARWPDNESPGATNNVRTTTWS